MKRVKKDNRLIADDGLVEKSDIFDRGYIGCCVVLSVVMVFLAVMAVIF